MPHMRTLSSSTISGGGPGPRKLFLRHHTGSSLPVMGMRKKASRDELVAELREDVGYWGMVGNDKNLAGASEGASALENGIVNSVTVGHTTYEVDESSDSPSGN